MHEMSLMQSLFDQLRQLAAEHEATRVIKVTMVIGPLSGVVVESLQFGFSVLAKQSPLTASATLEVVLPPVDYRCSDCGAVEKGVKSRPEVCPRCGDTLLIAEGGNELILQQVEME
ncbi:MAG: hydrogenase maturation nickel metallochaperone HypA [Desulfofustis sp. PB-SRB1]|jgi:hydrogenase nickel incorporation protein HypA/HybF|nr:hydrogenase maturation nickel metallochaperone HypA [Desulfofustis sp. PB-SRB1]MBM1001027.1 hydrogenase maturation nickel metallochaperone HypA [Desulfofustis sp. PB-SRB1]HBH27690.1 hydrogenase accessory protein HypA [Desulfofustis sp.]HBH32575.1 hydrogenase accessory protein HypA [Desulfofustis sp.]